MSGAFSFHGFIVCSQSRLALSYIHHGIQRGVHSMGPILVPRDLNIEHRETHRKPLPQNCIMSPEISKPFINSRNPRRLRVRSELYWGNCQNGPVFPISSSVAGTSWKYSLLRASQSSSRRLRKNFPEKSLNKSFRGIIPSAVVESN
jgi:hypothetical protein